MTRPIKVLQVTHSMGLGGVETWLMNILRNLDQRSIQFNFLVYNTMPQYYDEEIRQLGSRLIVCTHPTKTLSYYQDLRQKMLSEGPFDVVHAHGSVTIGVVMKLAADINIPIRIAHSHNKTKIKKRRLSSRLYRLLTKFWLMRFMTVGLGASEDACAHMFGTKWKTDKRCQALYYGLDWENFNRKIEKNIIRSELGLPLDALVIGHVGRFVAEKNHSFWLEVAEHIAKLQDNSYFLLVGDGELRNLIEERVTDKGLGERFVFTGARSDIWRILQAIDVFLFPSITEGLGISLVEAQASGLPCVVSDAVPTEAIIINSQVIRLPLNAGPVVWSQNVHKAAQQCRLDNFPSAIKAIKDSRFSIFTNIEVLTQLYNHSQI